MRAIPAPRLFVAVAGLAVAPREALRNATEGRWNTLRDALALLALGSIAAYTPDLAQALLIGWDLGLREGLFELARVLQLRVGPDLVVMAVAGAVVLLPARLLRGISLDRGLALAAACWIPLLLTRLAGHFIRLLLGRPPARPVLLPAQILQSPDWIVGLLWSAGIAVLVMVTLLGRGEDD